LSEKGASVSRQVDWIRREEEIKSDVDFPQESFFIHNFD